MAASEKKPSLAMVIEMAKAKKGDDSEPDMDDSEDTEGYDAAVDELADVMSIPDEQREAFTDAFKAAVMACK